MRDQKGTIRRPAVTMIGIDAGDADFIEQNIASLPNIAAVMAGEALRRLEVEPLSGAVWSTFMARATPDVHGIYHHIQWDPERMRVRRTHPDWIGGTEPFWRDLARSGSKVLSFDVPFLFKGDSAGAVEIANWGSHDLVDGFWCNDPQVEKLVRSFAPHHPMAFEVPVDKTPADLDEIYDGILKGVAMKADLVCALMDKVESDLFIVAFGETHRAGHILWPETGTNTSLVPATALLDVYKALDAAIGQIMRRIGPDGTLVLFSLHGMAANQSQSHLSAAMLKVALAEVSGTGSGETFGLIRTLRRNVPAPVQMAIAKAVPKAVRDYVVSREVSGGYRWSETPMISLDGDLCGYWRANIRQREKDGILAPDSNLLDDVAAEFMKFTTRDGAQIVQKVHFPARDWPGKRAHYLPDIVAEWNPDLLAIDTADHPSGATISARRYTGRTGNHRFKGFCTLHGSVPATQDIALPDHIKDLGRLAHALLQRATS
ncbi:alkaline phosphatase family protein [Tropicimonas sp. S265A]|uniref:alkaline phosphatase family protein n=1 Tax=Tropicimonas sp. S265A TaxID=3415134 RepID=UPI003C7C8387